MTAHEVGANDEQDNVCICSSQKHILFDARSANLFVATTTAKSEKGDLLTEREVRAGDVLKLSFFYDTYNIQIGEHEPRSKEG